jgi:5'(3')-deoxyribonucleotidase
MNINVLRGEIIIFTAFQNVLDNRFSIIKFFS